VATRPRAVLDTNVLVAALLAPRGPSGRLLRAFDRRRFTFVTSAAILDEMVDVLARDKIQRILSLSVEDIANIRVALQQIAEAAPGEYRDIDLVATDPNDNPVVATALEAQAEYVVTMDAADLLRLKVFLVSGHRPVQVVSPADFLRLLGPAR
jgi:putative PIN family toxin of toxin-antitoxin system